MVSEKMYQLGSKRSEIRELFEYGKKRIAEVGKENVYDFSLGNPSVPAPDCVRETLSDLISGDPVSLHGYTSAQGDAGVRAACADYINKTHGTGVTANDFYMTCGAAASLTISLNALAGEGDEVIVLAPYFPEYKVFITQAGMKCVEVKCREEDFQIDFAALSAALNAHTKAIIINSPNNPSGAVFSPATIEALAALLRDAEAKYGRPIFIIADEPYRELVYDAETVVPFIPNYYDNTLVCYSFSKSLSLPGERIGYILVPPKAAEHDAVYFAVCGAGRALGFVCAPSLFQKMVPACLGMTSDISVYKQNRDLLCEALTAYGYKVVRPDGAFYLFVKALEPDARAFGERAKAHDLLVVPSDSFGFPGYVRISYCVSTDMIRRSLPAFEALAKEYLG
ncbi:MAG: pyridoxal phosphate-dependent aminotransferase [Clostridia bacterium]|nr:pyridoxal phosphate-dependent aminotransferase [Clostridia bacterium]